MNKLVYLASPYSHPDPSVQDQRFKDVSRCAAILMECGVLVFSPIAHFTPIAIHGYLPHGWEFYAPFDTAYIHISQALLVACFDGWQESKGVKAECDIARELGLPIGFLSEPLNADLVRHYIQAAGLRSLPETRREIV